VTYGLSIGIEGGVDLEWPWTA